MVYRGLDQYNVGAEIFKLAQERGIAIISITHTTKTSYSDVFDCIRGTGTTSAVDTVMIFEGTNDRNKRVLHIQSRDMGDKRILLSTDQETLLYKSDGEISDQDYKDIIASDQPNGRPPKVTPEMRSQAKKLKEEGKTDAQIVKHFLEQYKVSVSTKTISRLWEDSEQG